MSRVTRSSVNLSGNIQEYLIENSSMATGGSTSDDIHSLLAMMARTLEAVTNQTNKNNPNSNQKEPAQPQHIKVKIAPLKDQTLHLTLGLVR